MKKAIALDLLGGSVVSMADAIGITPAAISQWPDELPDRLRDRVIAALVRQGKSVPAELAAAEAKAA